MSVKGDDYTFASTIGSPHLYGTAGDCILGQTNGFFMVNLTGTGFYLDPMVSLTFPSW